MSTEPGSWTARGAVIGSTIPLRTNVRSDTNGTVVVARLSAVAVLFPTSIDEAVAALADPAAEPLAGGTDFMVEVNAGLRRPEVVVALHRIAELRTWQRQGDWLRLGAGVTYTDMLELADLVPALAHAARTVGSPPIRNAGTIGGNVATASPAGDTLPVLAALDAVVDVIGPEGPRHVPLSDLIVGVKRTTLRPGELIAAVRVQVLDGPQEYRKVGTRNAMVISVASVAFAIDRLGRTVRCALGSVGPVPLRALEAEAWLAERIDWDALRVADSEALDEFGRMVAAAALPIDDHRSTAAYRRHAIGVLAMRTARAALAA
jgi:CO/xanthine dehydrogenase FAD-binding subunit